MLGEHFDNLEILNSDAFVAHLASHAETFEYLCGIRAGTDRTGSTETVVLAVSSLTNAAEAVALNYALEAFTLGGTDNIYERTFLEEVDCESLTQLGKSFERFELGQVSLGSHSCFLEKTGLGLVGVFFRFFLKTYLDSLVAIFLKSFYLSDNAGTNFDNSARHVFAVGTENGCHSDFFS